MSNEDQFTPSYDTLFLKRDERHMCHDQPPPVYNRLSEQRRDMPQSSADVESR